MGLNHGGDIVDEVIAWYFGGNKHSDWFDVKQNLCALRSTVSWPTGYWTVIKNDSSWAMFLNLSRKVGIAFNCFQLPRSNICDDKPMKFYFNDHQSRVGWFFWLVISFLVAFFMKQILEMSHFHWSNSAFCIKISRKKWSIWIFTSPWPIWIPYDSDETHSHPLMKRAIRAKVNLVRREIPKLVRCTLEALIVTWESNRCPLTSPIWFASCKKKHLNNIRNIYMKGNNIHVVHVFILIV